VGIVYPYSSSLTINGVILTANQEIKKLLALSIASFSTLDATGYPIATLVTFAMADKTPLLLLSKLSNHRVNVENDNRASLLIAKSGKGDPLAYPRVSLIGKVFLAKKTDYREIYLAQNPKSALYIDFADFDIFTFNVETVQYNGGFGRAMTLDYAEV
jgi:heme iron utilization protein